MDSKILARKGMVLGASIALALLGGLVLDRTAAGTSPTAGTQTPAELNVVLSGSYYCAYTVTPYYPGPVVDPNPAIETFAETSDSLTLGSSGGNLPVTLTGPGSGGPVGIGPGFGGHAPVGGTTLTAPPVSGFSTGHSFNDGSIEDCVRFAQAMSATVRGLGCTTSDVRRRQPPLSQGYSSASASFNFVCEGPQANIIHDMGELSRAVLALKLQSP